MIGPCADDAMCLVGCYSFPNHVGVHHPDLPIGISMPTVLEALRTEFPNASIRYAQGCDIDGQGTAGIRRGARARERVRSGHPGAWGPRGPVRPRNLRRGLRRRNPEAAGSAGRTARGGAVAGRRCRADHGCRDDRTTLAPRRNARAPSCSPSSRARRAAVRSPGSSADGSIRAAGCPSRSRATPNTQSASYLASELARRSDVSNVDPDGRLPVRPRARVLRFLLVGPDRGWFPRLSRARPSTRGPRRTASSRSG